MSKADVNKLRIALVNIAQQRGARKGKTGKDIFGQILDNNIQGYILAPQVIYKEISRPESPFRVDIEGRSISDTERQQFSEIISADLYKEYKRTAVSKYKTYNVTGKKDLPSDFLNSPNISVGYDDARRIIYYKAIKTGNSNFRSFTEGLLVEVENKIKNRSNPLDPTRIYVTPDNRLLDAWKKIAERIRSEQLSLGKTREQAGQVVGRRKKKFFEESGVPWGGIQAGHIFGSKASGIAGLLEDPNDIAHQDLENLILLKVIPADLRPRLQQAVKFIIDTDTELEWQRVFKKDGPTASITFLIPESAVNNTTSGGVIGSFSQRTLQPLIDELILRLPTLKGSPTYIELLSKYIEDTFLDKNISTKRYRTTSKGKSIKRGTINVTKIPAKKVRVTQKRSKRGQGGPYTDLNSLIGFLNSKLHDKIKENMGKGGSKQILNYRTGRFARSAKIKSFFNPGERNAIGAVVKYRRNPYGVFEPGGPPNLALPGRNPARIFGRSIRQLLQEEKIATLRKVKVELRG